MASVNDASASCALGRCRFSLTYLRPSALLGLAAASSLLACISRGSRSTRYSTPSDRHCVGCGRECACFPGERADTDAACAGIGASLTAAE